MSARSKQLLTEITEELNELLRASAKEQADIAREVRNKVHELVSTSSDALTTYYIIECRLRNTSFAWKEASSCRFSNLKEAKDVVQVWTNDIPSTLTNPQYEYRVRKEEVWEV